MFMARVRAVENRRWLLRDTNNGYTESIDPYGQNGGATGDRYARAADCALRFSQRFDAVCEVWRLVFVVVHRGDGGPAWFCPG